MVERFCDEALWLDAGRIKGSGDPKRIVGAYLTDIEQREEHELAAGDVKAQQSAAAAVAAPAESEPPRPDNPVETGREPADMFRASEGRWGSREVEITGVTFVGRDGEAGHVFHSGDPVEIRIRMTAPLPIDDFVVGIGIFNAEGVCCYGTNTTIEELRGERLSGDAEAVFAITALDLVEGTYKMDVAVHKFDGFPYDYHRLLYTFRVKSRARDVGIYRPRHSWRFAGGITFTKNADR